MKAFALESPGQPASLTQVPKPEIGEDGTLVAVRAASVNGIDVYQASGYLAAMMEHAMPTVVGRDFAGVVEAVGSGVSGFAAGDEVFGFIPAAPPLRSGAFGEYVGGAPELVLAAKPAALDFHAVPPFPWPARLRLTCSRRSTAARARWSSSSARPAAWVHLPCSSLPGAA